MRFVVLISWLMLLPGCGATPVDVALTGGVAYALYGDELETVTQEELQDPKTYRDAVPPQAKSSARRFADNVRNNTRHNAKKLKEWWFYDPASEPKYARAVPPSYCYTVMQDVVCYRQPMPGWEHRLLGYQGTGAEPPPPAVTQPLPSLAHNSAIAPETRLKAAKPVFTGMPQDLSRIKEEPEEISPQGAQEILPNPALSPQL